MTCTDFNTICDGSRLPHEWSATETAAAVKHVQGCPACRNRCRLAYHTTTPEIRDAAHAAVRENEGRVAQVLRRDPEVDSNGD